MHTGSWCTSLKIIIRERKGGVHDSGCNTFLSGLECGASRGGVKSLIQEYVAKDWELTLAREI